MVDADAPTTFDLGPTPQTDPLGATVMGPAPDLNKTVAGTMPPLTSEIPPPAQTGPTQPPTQTWQDMPQPPQPRQPPGPTPAQPSQPPPSPSSAQTGPTTTSPLGAPPQGATSQPPPPSSVSGGLAHAAGSTGPQTGPVAGAPQSGALGAQSIPPQAKSSKLPLLIGGIAVLLLLVIGGGAALYFIGMRPKTETSNTGGTGSPSLERDAGTANSNSSANANSANANTASNAAQPPVVQPPNSTQFVNSREKVTGSLAEHFVDFSLYYPNNWILDPKAGTGGSSNFFRASRYFQNDPQSYVHEIMSVGWYQSNGTMQLDRPIFPNRVEYFNNLLQKDFPEYQKISEGETSVNGLQGYQFTFKSTVKGTDKGDIDLWGRVIFLPVGTESARNGVVLMMVASSDLPEIKGLEDVGEKGELPVILKTFRFGSQG